MLTFLLATVSEIQSGGWVSVHLHRVDLGYSLRRANPVPMIIKQTQTSRKSQVQGQSGGKEITPNTFSAAQWQFQGIAKLHSEDNQK